MKRTIPHFFDAAVEAVPSKTWLLHEDRGFTYEQAHAAIAGGAATLAGLGVGKGDLVLVTLRNTPEYLFTWLALMRLGAILVAANPASPATELAGLAGQTEPRLVVGDAGVALAGFFDVEALFSAPGPGGKPGPGSTDVEPEDPAVLIPTSGTTGRSKLVTQTHLAYVMAGEGFPWWLELTADDRLMTSLPLFHINAPAYSVLGSVAARASLVLLPRFSASTFVDSARRYGATEFNAIGAMVEMLMRQPERPDDADNPLRLCYTGPSPTEKRQLEIERRFGLQVVCGYALSETPYGLVWRRGTRPYGTLGSVRQHPTLGEVNEARLVLDGQPAPPGEVGELELRNPAVMKGYWGMPEETAKVLSPDGWLR
ncbi:MAG TPA: AMP-binding protein, partial [Acidimicrobiia bacterium]